LRAQGFRLCPGARHGEHPVVRVPGQPVDGKTPVTALGPFVAVEPGLGEVFVEDRQGDVRDHGTEDPALRGAHPGLLQRAVLGEDPRLQERLHQRQDTLVADPTTHPVHQGRVRDLVETGFDVSFHDPLIRAGREMVHLGHGVMSPPLRANP
jgi:hypothetical protein